MQLAPNIEKDYFIHEVSYHILSIDSDCSLSCKNGQVTCRVGDSTPKTIALEDVASIIITSFSVVLHSHLLLEAAKHGVALIICESFKPVSLLIPANRSSDTLLTRAQVEISAKKRADLWRKTIDAKCANQLSLASELAPDHYGLAALKSIAKGKHPAKEAMCAKAFWQIYGSALGQANFNRDRGEDGINALLNYGYAVLLSTVLQKLFAVGLDPTFGVGHAIRERSTPLAYDLMEPFRSCVDWRVAQWVKDHPDPDEHRVSREFRAWVTRFPLVKVEHLGFTLEVQGVIEGVVRSFRQALMLNNLALYKPWTLSNSKWAGC
jgi:CRISPR-associated protein Cas1